MKLLQIWHENSFSYQSWGERFCFWLVNWVALVNSVLQAVSFCFLHVDPIHEWLLDKVTDRCHKCDRKEAQEEARKQYDRVCGGDDYG